MKHAVNSFFLALLVLASAVSCNNGVMPEPEVLNPDNPATTSGSIKFNLTGAKAVGAADLAATKAIKGLGDYRSIKSVLSRDTVDEYGLVKVLEDGTVEMAMEFPDGMWMPKVMFIAKSPVEGKKDLYVAFENSINFYDQETQQMVELGSFLHIKEDGSYQSVITNTNGRVKNYSWYGNDSYRPVSFDGAGRVYYVFETWGASTSSNQLFVYDPATGENKPLTPALSGMYYNNFEVSADGKRLFVQGERLSGASRSSFFRMYPIDNVESPVTVYYTSNTSTWVRGYKLSPSGATTQNIILNGYNIRGINGLLRANVVSDSSLTYEPLFDSSTDSSQWFQPEYNEWYSDWEAKTYYNGFFDRFSYSDIYLVMTDPTDLYYLRLSDYIWAKQYNPTADSISVLKNPNATDWNAMGQTQKTIANGTFGFASSTTTAGSPIASTAANILDLYDDAGVGIKALTFVRRWNGNVQTIEQFPVSKELIDSIILHPADSDYLTQYQWNTHWYKNEDRAQGLDSEAILKYAGKYFKDDVLFKYSTNAAGDASFSAFESKGYYKYSEIYGTGASISSTFFLDNYFVMQGDSVTKALTFNKYKADNNLSWLNFQSVSALHYDATGACWAIIGGSMWGGGSSTVRPVKILKPDGTKTLEFIPSLNTSTYNPVSFLISGNQMFFRDGLLDADGFESGYHKLYVLDLTASNPTPTDLLVNVTENGSLEIVSFSVSGSTLYFTGVKGTGVIGGKIDLATLEYTELDDSYLLRNIEAY